MNLKNKTNNNQQKVIFRPQTLPCRNYGHTCWIYDDALIDNIFVVRSRIGVLYPAARI